MSSTLEVPGTEGAADESLQDIKDQTRAAEQVVRDAAQSVRANIVEARKAGESSQRMLATAQRPGEIASRQVDPRTGAIITDWDRAHAEGDGKQVSSGGRLAA